MQSVANHHTHLCTTEPSSATDYVRTLSQHHPNTPARSSEVGSVGESIENQYSPRTGPGTARRTMTSSKNEIPDTPSAKTGCANIP